MNANKLTRRERKSMNQLIKALARNANGDATSRDIEIIAKNRDMLARMRAEANGVNGYTGVSHGVPHTTHTVSKSNPFVFHTTQAKKDEHVFVCAEAKEITSKCPLNPKVPSILVKYLQWQTWLNLAKAIDTEWIALLKGRLGVDSQGDAAYIIDSYYFPPQTASGAHVDIPTGVIPRPGTIGAIHSHVDMGVFWSGTDMAHSNWPVEIVINRRENYEAVARYQLKCGEWAKSKTEVYLSGDKIGPIVNRAINEAFAEGTRLSKLSKPSAKQVAIVQAAKDEPEPTVSVSGNITPITCVCGHDILLHYKNSNNEEMHGCRIQECSCTQFTTISPIPPKVETQPEKKEDAQTSIVFPIGEGLSGAGETTTTSSSTLTQPLTEQADEFPVDELGDEVCPTCEGVGFVEDPSSGPRGVMTCGLCQGDGLTELGRVRRADNKPN